MDARTFHDAAKEVAAKLHPLHCRATSLDGATQKLLAPADVGGSGIQVTAPVMVLSALLAAVAVFIVLLPPKAPSRGSGRGLKF